MSEEIRVENIRLMDDDLEALFQQVKDKAIVLNDIPYETEEDRNNFDRLIMTTYENTNVLSSIPRCACPEPKLMGMVKLGQYCPSCKTTVQMPAENDIIHDVWLRAPEGVVGFISPKIWIELSSVLSPGTFNLLEWICDPTMRLPDNHPRPTDRMRVAVMERVGFPRGVNGLANNLEWFIDLLPQLSIRHCEQIQRSLRRNKDIMFSKHIPMPTRVMMVLEKTNRGTYAQLPISAAADSARTIAGLNKELGAVSIRQLEKLTTKVMKNMGDYYINMDESVVGKKKAWLRGHVLRSRNNFCWRGVITSNVNPHYYRALEIPWEIGAEIFKWHLVNFLTKKKGFTITAAYALVESHARMYHKLLDEGFHYIIDNVHQDDKTIPELSSKVRTQGFPCLFQRNPSLPRSSMQECLIVGVKTNVDDQTCTMSPQICSGFNADGLQ